MNKETIILTRKSLLDNLCKEHNKALDLIIELVKEDSSNLCEVVMEHHNRWCANNCENFNRACLKKFLAHYKKED